MRAARIAQRKHAKKAWLATARWAVNTSGMAMRNARYEWRLAGSWHKSCLACKIRAKGPAGQAPGKNHANATGSQPSLAGRPGAASLGPQRNGMGRCLLAGRGRQIMASQRLRRRRELLPDGLAVSASSGALHAALLGHFPT